VKRNPAITEEEFHSYWSKVHAPLASLFLKRNGVVKYTQFHSPTSSKDTLAPFTTAGAGPVLQFDGYAELLVLSLDVIVKGFSDPEYAEKVSPDEDYLFDKSENVMCVGMRRFLLRGRGHCVGEG